MTYFIVAQRHNIEIGNEISSENTKLYVFSNILFVYLCIYRHTFAFFSMAKRRFQFQLYLSNDNFDT